MKKVSIPAAVSVFPHELYQAPRSGSVGGVEQAYHRLIYFNEVGGGGHVAAWQQPRLGGGAKNCPNGERCGFCGHPTGREGHGSRQLTMMLVDGVLTPCEQFCGKGTESYPFPCGCGSVATCACCGCCKGCGNSARTFCGWDCRRKTESFPFPCGCGTVTTCLVCGRCRGCGNGDQ